MAGFNVFGMGAGDDPRAQAALWYANARANDPAARGRAPQRGRGKAPNAFSKEALKFYRALGAQAKITRNISKSLPVLPKVTPGLPGGEPTTEQNQKILALQMIAKQREQQATAKKKAESIKSGVRPEPGSNRRPTGAPGTFGRDNARSHGGQAFGPGGQPGGPGKTPRPMPPQGTPGPSPQDVLRYTQAANANQQFENMPTEEPHTLRPGVVGVNFPGDPEQWLERARQLEGIGDEEWQNVKGRYMEGSRQEGAENVYQHGYTDVNSGGNEAFGPAQIAKGTFPAWSNPQYGNRFNPVHSYVAMLRGLKNKYGSYEAGANVIARPGGYG